MKTLLYLQASPRAERSHSRKVADAFVQAYLRANPDDKVVTVDLFKMALPAFDGVAVQAKYSILHGQKFSAEEAAAWQGIESVIAQFKAADKYLLAVPMWNFGIPYRLKHYIDIITQPGYTFSFSPSEGYKGLVIGKPVCVVYARGGDYSKGSPAEGFDQQTRYLEQALGFIGFAGIQSIAVEPTLAAPELFGEREVSALAKAQSLAATF